MTTPAVTPVNSINKVTTANPAPQDGIWSQEINPPVPAGHADSTHNKNDSFNHSENPDAAANQDPAAINISPEVKQAAKESFLKGKEVILAASAAIMAALVAFRNKKLPMMKSTLSEYVKKAGKLTPVIGGYVKKYSKVVDASELGEFVNELKTKGPQHFRNIDIHSSNLNKKPMAEVLQDIRTIANTYVTHNNNKKPVIDIILKQEHSGKIQQIIDDFNKNGAINVADEVDRVVVRMEPVKKSLKALGGLNTIELNVGATRYMDKRAGILDYIGNYIKRSLTSRKLPD